METKPFSIQSPEQIAKDYNGNKQKIAEAMQMGIVDPTAGTLAGMFIDRIRAAAQAEQAPQQTVAQQVFAPPAPAGLGAAPPGPPMGAPPAPSAPMGPPAGLGATPEAAQMPQMPPQQPPMGMAEGGMVPPYAMGGGLSDVPIPSGMFDEPNNGGYAGGGIVAFAHAGPVADDSEDIEVTAREEPESYNGFYRDPTLNKTEVIDQLAPRQTKYEDELNKFYENVRSPQAQKAQAKEDFWSAIGQMGAKMASTPGSLFQSFNAGAAEALPRLATAAKERRAEQRDAIKTLAMQEGLKNKEALEVANVAVNMSGKYGEYRDNDLNRKQQIVLKKIEEAGANARNAAQVGASMFGSRESAAASRFSAIKGTERDAMVAKREARRYFDTIVAETPQYKRLKATNPNGYEAARRKFVQDEVYGPSVNLGNY